MRKSRSEKYKANSVEALLTRLSEYKTDNDFLKERVQNLEAELRHERNAACEAARRR